MREVMLLTRTVSIETVPADIPIMNDVWYGASPDYLALVPTKKQTLILPGNLFSLQSLFLWMMDQPGTKAVYLFSGGRLYAEYCPKHQVLVTYEIEREEIILYDRREEFPTYYYLPWVGQRQSGTWEMEKDLHSAHFFSWISKEEVNP